MLNLDENVLNSISKHKGDSFNLDSYRILSGKSLTSYNIYNLVEALNKNRNITNLSLRDNLLDDAHAKILSHLIYVTLLDVRKNNISAEALDYLLKSTINTVYNDECNIMRNDDPKKALRTPTELTYDSIVVNLTPEKEEIKKRRCFGCFFSFYSKKVERVNTSNSNASRNSFAL